MIQSAWRLRNLSIASVLVLTISNIFLTVRLIQHSDCPRISRSAQLIGPPRLDINQITMRIPKNEANLKQNQRKSITRTHEEEYYLGNSANDTIMAEDVESYPFANVDFRLGRWDARRLYKIFDYVLVGERYVDLSDAYKVCLATQSSVERIYSIVELASQWTGPISLALFASGDDELRLLQLYVAHIRACHPDVRERVTIHLALPGDRVPPNGQAPLQIIEPNSGQDDCSLKPLDFLQQILKTSNPETEKWRTKNPYPQNHMRNVARKACQSGYVFMTDVDIIPSNGFADSLNEFLKIPNCPNAQCAYVVPTYELDVRVQFPKNKADLIRLAKKGLARPFHHKIFIYNQFATNFTKWQAVTVESDATHVSHIVTNFEFLYEPFYIAPDTVPLHDERFLGYGYTRNTQVYETYVAGFQFVVLSPIFTCHWGLQNRRARPAWRERQNYLNRRHFEVFKREVFARYHRDPLKMMQPKKPAVPHPVPPAKVL